MDAPLSLLGPARGERNRLSPPRRRGYEHAEGRWSTPGPPGRVFLLKGTRLWPPSRQEAGTSPDPRVKKMGVKQLPPSCATYLEQLLFLVPPLKTKLKTSTCNEILDAGNGIS